MCNIILTVIGLLAIGGFVIWTIVRLAGFLPDLIGAVEFYRKYKNDPDTIDNLKSMEDTIVHALEKHLKLHIWNYDRVGYYGPDMFKLAGNERELEEVVKERVAKKVGKLKKQKAEKEAKKRKKK